MKDASEVPLTGAYCRGLIEANLAPLLIIDQDGVIGDANKAAEDLTGIGRHELIGSFLGSYFTEPDKAALVYRTPFKNRLIRDCELLLCRRDGIIIPVLCNASVYCDESDNIMGVLVSMRNITDLKRSEEARLESEKKYRIIADNTYDWEFWIGPDRTFIYNSPSCERVTGYRASEFEEDSGLFLRIVHPDDLASVLDHLETDKTELPSPAEMEFRILHRDGSLRWISHLCQPVFDDRGVFIGTRGSNRDISIRKQAQEALWESEEIYRILAEKSLVGLYIVQGGKFTYVSSNITLITGYDPSELLGKDAYILVHPDDKDSVAVKARKMLKSKDIVPHEFRIIRKDNEVRWVMEKVASIPYKGTAAIIGSSMDITEWKRGEEERQRLEDRLRQAQKMEAIGILAGGIAHDFNNILGAVSGFTELALENKPEDDKVRKYLEQIFGATRRATDLVSQILEFSRQKERELRPMKMTPVIKEVAKLLRATIPATIAIHLKLDADPDMIMGDISQIHQILMNLCTNANYAMREQGGVLLVEMRTADIAKATAEHPDLKPGRYLHLSVGDTGHGIAPEYLDRIFDPFFTMKKTGDGTGLGLSVVHGIVKSLHGFISVHSRIGEGTVFDIWFPLLPEGCVAEKADPKTGAIHGEGRILVVDDEHVLSEMTRDMLERLGYEVTAMTGSLEALHVFSADPEKFDLIVTDQTMPHMTGLTLAEEILKIRAGMPIILCTGFSHIINPELAKAVGITEIIMKPVLMHEIASIIQRVLQEAGQGR